MTDEELVKGLAAHMLGFDFNPPDVRRIAEFLLPEVRRAQAGALREAGALLNYRANLLDRI